MEMFIFFISLIQYKKILRYRKSVFRRILSQADICDPLRCLLITGYQTNINQISKMPQASKWLCGISVYFYLFLSVSICFCLLL